MLQFEFVRKKPKAYCTVNLEGYMNYRGSSTKLKLQLKGVTDIETEVYIEPEILNALNDDLATMFNTEVQPYTKENISLGRKLCKQIVYPMVKIKTKLREKHLKTYKNE